MKTNRFFVWGCLLALVAGIVLVASVNRDWFAQVSEPTAVEKSRKEWVESMKKTRPNNRKELASALGLHEDDIATIGGVDRPKRDIAFVNQEEKSDNGAPKQVASVRKSIPAVMAGRSPVLAGNENAQVASLFAELNAEVPIKAAMSSYFSEDFDLDAYRKNPDEYLTKFRPGRAFSPAKHSADVTPLTAISDGFHEVLQGEQVILKVRAEAGMPVSFYTPQVGWFTESLLSSVTVAASDEGIASATFKAGPGSIGLVDILAASPAHSEQLQFRVNVELPEKRADSEADE